MDTSDAVNDAVTALGETMKNLFPSLETISAAFYSPPATVFSDERDMIDRFSFRLSPNNPVDSYVMQNMIEDMDEGVNMSALVKMVLFLYYKSKETKET